MRPFSSSQSMGLKFRNWGLHQLWQMKGRKICARVFGSLLQISLSTGTRKVNGSIENPRFQQHKNRFARDRHNLRGLIWLQADDPNLDSPSSTTSWGLKPSSYVSKIYTHRCTFYHLSLTNATIVRPTILWNLEFVHFSLFHLIHRVSAFTVLPGLGTKTTLKALRVYWKNPGVLHFATSCSASGTKQEHTGCIKPNALLENPIAVRHMFGNYDERDKQQVQ